MEERAASSSRKERFRFYLIYTGVFAVVSLLVYAPFWMSGKTMVWRTDGLAQHYNAFVYLGIYLRDILQTLITQHQLVLPMWEFGLGYGGDIVTTLQYYVLGDPFALVSAVTPSAFAGEVYSLLIVLRVFLAGAFFCAFSRKMECKPLPSICAALAYCFCGYAIYGAVRHPYFTNPMIWLPLLLLGAEKILRKERPVLFIMMVFIAAVSNFYFFYVLVLLTVLYVIFRYFCLYQENRWKNLLLCFLKFMGTALLGVAMAAVLFLPAVLSFLSSSRSDTQYLFPLFYNRAFYEKVLGAFVSNTSPGGWTWYGFSPVVLLGVGGLFLKRKQEGWLKGLIVFLLLASLLPIAGYVFNGFGYVSNRWMFGFAFFCAFALAKSLPLYQSLSTGQKWALGTGVSLYTVLCLLLDRSRTQSAMAGCMILCLSLLFFLGASTIPKIRLGHFSPSRRRVIQTGALALTILGILNVSFHQYSLTEGDYAGQFQGRYETMVRLEESRAAVWDQIEEEDFYRIDETASGSTQIPNYPIFAGQSTTMAYWSLINPDIAPYVMFHSAYSDLSHKIRGLQSRTMLQPFAAVKYFVCEAGQEKQVPYGYTFVGQEETYDGKTVKLYQTENSLPLGYTCDSWVSAKDCESMDFAQRQQAMLQGAIIENEENGSGLEKAQLTFQQEEPEFTVKCGEGTVYEPGKITVKKANASLALTFSAPGSRELYLQLMGLEFESHSPYEYYTQDQWDSLYRYDKNRIQYQWKYWSPAKSSIITAASAGVSASASYYTPYYDWTQGRSDFLLNLCYSEESRQTMTVTFSEPGVYTFDSMKVICQPMDDFETRISDMKEDVLENTAIGVNTITGNISLEKEKMLCFSVPYSNGWTLLVDGQETELFRTNLIFMGTVLSEGEHRIELRYETPWLKAGALISCVAFGLFLLMELLIFLKRRRFR